jgi:hypothetical protein
VLDEQAVDIRAGEDFAREVLTRLPRSFVAELLGELQAKSRRFQAALSPEGLRLLDPGRAQVLLRSVFGTRRRAAALVAEVGVDGLRRSFQALLYGKEPVRQRFTAFCAALHGVCPRGESVDLAGEVLHYVLPDRYWLWTRWMWNPTTQTGALRFVVADWRTLLAATPGEVYERVGEAVAYAETARQSLGVFSGAGDPGNPFLPDVYLACVYTLYLFTVLRMRMSKEFTRVLPDPQELVRRLLGVYPGEGDDGEARA